MANGVAEFTKSGKPRKASYEMVAKWIDGEWKTVEHESIIKGFQENGYIDYAGNKNVLHSGLQQTLAEGQVPQDLIQEVNDFIAEFSAIDNDDQETAIETDSEPDDDQNDPSSSSDEFASSSDELSSSDESSNSSEESSEASDTNKSKIDPGPSRVEEDSKLSEVDVVE